MTYIQERGSTHVYHVNRMSKEEMDHMISLCVHDQPAYCVAACPFKVDTKEMLFYASKGNFKKALAIYDSMFQTGNKILDTILTEKKLYCEYNKINMTCIAEGEKLDFLSESELCSLFGNIVDNAVTAVSHLEEEEKRTINILVRTRGNFLSIHEENYYEGELKKSGDGFETTKKDKEHHGFGLKSIKMITENHHGNMSVTAEDGVFNINILIPLPSMEK